MVFYSKVFVHNIAILHDRVVTMHSVHRSLVVFNAFEFLQVWLLATNAVRQTNWCLTLDDILRKHAVVFNTSSLKRMVNVEPVTQWQSKSVVYGDKLLRKCSYMNLTATKHVLQACNIKHIVIANNIKSREIDQTKLLIVCCSWNI